MPRATRWERSTPGMGYAIGKADDDLERRVGEKRGDLRLVDRGRQHDWCGDDGRRHARLDMHVLGAHVEPFDVAITPSHVVHIHADLAELTDQQSVLRRIDPEVIEDEADPIPADRRLELSPDQGDRRCGYDVVQDTGRGEAEHVDQPRHALGDRLWQLRRRRR